MTKSKIAFVGFMGAILMSVGTANAATTSVATKGYVDQQVKTVQDTLGNSENGLVADVAELKQNAVTKDDMDSTIEGLNLDQYELSSNKVGAISDTMSDTDKANKYPTAGAVLDQLSKVGLSDEDKQAIADLTGEGGLITRVNEVEDAVETLTGIGVDSVAGQIASAITAHNTAADEKYQAQSTAAYSMGNATGGWTALEVGEVAALTSGITAEKVAAYDAVAGDEGTIAEMQTTIDGLDADINDKENGLKTIVAENAAAIEDNAADITELKSTVNDEETGLATKLPKPTADCVSDSGACVLMTTAAGISWVQVTKPLEDGATTE